MVIINIGLPSTESLVVDQIVFNCFQIDGPQINGRLYGRVIESLDPTVRNQARAN